MMNKQEAIKLVEQMGEYERFVDEPVSKKSVLDIISQIDEPQKVVVPKFVAEWIEYCKSNKLTLLGAFDPVSEHGIGLADTFTEVWKGIDWAKRNQETFARAWLDGYEVEKEKLYTARLKLLSFKKYSYINKNKDKKTLFFSDSDDLTDVYQTHFTQAELEGLGVWDNPAFEIEEVEE
ncbi:hypothetical protein CS009_04875 [Streptococcus macedonicus]|uniref:DUF1642 domain-containing protein n=2 Tax=Streptococcus macedonicus TaxID=59310 RepID=A0AAP8KCG2_STRMC|nr:hypothetical protein CS009_04875 [Streptococcus macedonicus]